MKALALALGLAITAGSIPSVASAHPGWHRTAWHHGARHARVCVTKWHHGHRVRNCYWR